MLARISTRKIVATGAAVLLMTAGAAAATSAARTGDQQNGANSAIQAHHHDTYGEHATQGRHGKALKVTLRGVEGQKVGVVSLRRAGDVLVVSGLTWGLTPGFHGFHIHTTGLCEADAPGGPFATAGGHLDAGAAHTHSDHAGDMPSLLVTENGGRTQGSSPTGSRSLSSEKATDPRSWCMRIATTSRTFRSATRPAVSSAPMTAPRRQGMPEPGRHVASSTDPRRGPRA